MMDEGRPQQRQKKVAIIGGGLGGLSAAISLAQEGYGVAVYEKNGQIGGKLNLLQANGYSFDLGPSILTLPHFFEPLFARSGRKMSDYFTIVPLRPHWRNFFEDGTVIDLVPEPDAMAEQARKAGEDPEAVQHFLGYSSQLYDLVNEGYFQKGLDTSADFRRHYGLMNFMKFDLLRTMHQGVARYLKSPYLRDIFDFFIKYVGSSAYDAPAFMNCLPTIQFRHDLWYVEGGLYNIARGLDRLIRELGIDVHLNTEVLAIQTERARVTGLSLKDGGTVDADIVVSNMEVIPAYRDLLQENENFLRKLPPFRARLQRVGSRPRASTWSIHNSPITTSSFRTTSGVTLTVYSAGRSLPHDPTVLPGRSIKKRLNRGAAWLRLSQDSASHTTH